MLFFYFERILKNGFQNDDNKINNICSWMFLKSAY